MISRTRRLLHALATVALACVGLTVVATPAEATIYRLCTGYTSCANAGMSHAGYAQASGSMYWRMYSGHNCTNYAAYRMVKSGLPNERPWSGGGNATYWGTSMPRITDTVPRVGSIAWWRAGVYPAGSSGHVAYVEEVVSSSEIIVSQDSWGGEFSWARITRTSGWPSGFIHFNDVPLENVTRPVVTGEPRLGQTLTATSGTWRPRNPDVIYEWRAGGQTLQQGSLATLELTKDLVDKRVRVKVTATELGYPTGTARSERTAPVRAGTITNTTAPTVSGTPEVGATLSATGGRWSPRVDSRSYQWRADGTPLDGATGKTLEVTAAHVDKALSVTVTGVRAGYTPESATSAATAAVSRREIVATQQPEVSGAWRLGERLTLAPGAAKPEATRSVKWFRDGTPVPDATRLRYRLRPADLGSAITARVTWSRPDYRNLRLDTPATGTVRSVTVLEAAVEERAGGFVATTSVAAPHVDVVPSVVRVMRGKQLLAEKPVRADGTVRLRVRDQRPGERTYRFVVPRSDVTTHTKVVRTVTIQ